MLQTQTLQTTIHPTNLPVGEVKEAYYRLIQLLATRWDKITAVNLATDFMLKYYLKPEPEEPEPKEVIPTIVELMPVE